MRGLLQATAVLLWVWSIPIAESTWTCSTDPIDFYNHFACKPIYQIQVWDAAMQCVLTEDSEFWCRGRESYSRMGLVGEVGLSVDYQYYTLAASGISKSMQSYYFESEGASTLLLTTEGVIIGSGLTSEAKLPAVTYTFTPRSPPVAFVPDDFGAVKYLAVSLWAACAHNITTLYCWGQATRSACTDDTWGANKCGNQPTFDSTYPAVPHFFEGYSITHLALGNVGCVTLSKNDDPTKQEMRCWGASSSKFDNWPGTWNQSIPTAPASGLENHTFHALDCAISTSVSFCCVVASTPTVNRQVKCLGPTSYIGANGNSTLGQDAWVVFEPPSQVKQVSVHETYACVLFEDEFTVKCFGLEIHGRMWYSRAFVNAIGDRDNVLGDSPGETQLIPAINFHGRRIKKIQVYYSTLCAIFYGGTHACVGETESNGVKPGPYIPTLGYVMENGTHVVGMNAYNDSYFMAVGDEYGGGFNHTGDNTTLCPSGWSVNESDCKISGATLCQQPHATVCPDNQYGNPPCTEISDRVCVSCPAGFGCSNGVDAVPCEPGFTSEEAGAVCVACPDGFFCPGGLAAQLCDLCENKSVSVACTNSTDTVCVSDPPSNQGMGITDTILIVVIGALGFGVAVAFLIMCRSTKVKSSPKSSRINFFRKQ